MKIHFRPKTTVICLVLMAGMIRASIWQWDRHVAKQHYIEKMEERLQLEPVPLDAVLPSAPLEKDLWDPLIRRRVMVTGRYDFEHEMILRNRRLDGAAGVYALTPLQLEGSDLRIIVNRGFLPLSRSGSTDRRAFQKEAQASFVGMLKESSPPRWILSPKDPLSGSGYPWVDAWLRVDIEAMAKQLSYPVAPVHLEIINTSDLEAAKREILKSSAGREELLVMGMKEANVAMPDVRPGLIYPVPVFDAVIPPGRHLGYVYEWAIMAVVTFLIMIVLQLRPPLPRK